MCDVVASVSAVLSQTCLQAALADAVPAVLQHHLMAIASEARAQLLPGPGRDGVLPGMQVRRAHPDSNRTPLARAGVRKIARALQSAVH